MASDVVSHYSVEGLEASICSALENAGAGLARLTPGDLAPVDEFHIRGIEATRELCALVDIPAGSSVLDLGCGLGGSCRYLAVQLDCHVTGIDLTQAYCDLAERLSHLVGLAERTTFRQCNACDLPYDDDSFDFVWTEHAQMNIEAKSTFYGEAFRVLKPGGRFVFHDIFQGEGGAVHFPVPWADHPGISHLWTGDRVRQSLRAAGFVEERWEDRSTVSATWFGGVVERIQRDGPPPLGIHLLMGKSARVKLENILRNLEEGRINAVQGVFRKPV